MMFTFLVLKQLLEHCIRKEIVNRSQFVQFVTSGDNESALRLGMRRTACIASGMPTVEACIKVPTWAGQVTSLQKCSVECSTVWC